MKNTITAVDLFCGAGGTSTGLIKAAESIGKKVELTAINHWNTAIETHLKNHPGVRHLCENLDNVNPRKLFPQGRINLLVASPECTHHSNARGGVPCSDQSRATAWRVVDWAASIYIDNILIENVPEFMSWGPLGVNGKPLKSKKGETFKAFVSALESLHYRVEFRVLNAADYGDPTCRKRFFLIARKNRRRITWPAPTHAERGYKAQGGKVIAPWVPAREIIDWSLEGKSIFNRKKPLAEKTLARIEYGLRKFGGEDFLVKFFGTGQGVSLDKPMDTVTTSGNHHGLVQPFLAHFRGNSKAQGVDSPLPTVMTKDKLGLVEPFIAIMKGQSKARSTKAPLPTLTTQNNMYLCQPFLTRFHGGKDSEKRVHDVDGPLPVVDTSNRYGLIEPSFIVPQFGERDGQNPRCHDLKTPLPTVTSHGAGALVTPFILPQQQGRPGQLRVKSVDDPLSTITTTGAEQLVEPSFLVGIDHASAGEKHVRSLDRPAPTAVTQQNYALIHAHLIKYFGTGRAQSVDEPLGTVTTKDRFGLVEIFEKTPGLDIRLRMLQPHELAAAQSFPDDYQFCGNKGEVVKQIGNAVPGRTAKALCRELIA